MVHQRSRWNSDQTGFIGSFDFRDLWWMANARLREAETSAFLWARDILTSSMARSRLQVQSVLNASSRCLVSKTITHHLQKKPNLVLWDFLSLERPWDNFAINIDDSETHITAKNETVRSVKFDEHFARPMSFERPFATSWITDLNRNHPEETRPKRSPNDIRREKIVINRRKTYFHGKNRWDLRWLGFNLRSSKHRDCSAQRLRTTVMSWREQITYIINQWRVMLHI